jgi:hypothetical protein
MGTKRPSRDEKNVLAYQLPVCVRVTVQYASDSRRDVSHAHRPAYERAREGSWQVRQVIRADAVAKQRRASFCFYFQSDRKAGQEHDRIQTDGCSEADIESGCFEEPSVVIPTHGQDASFIQEPAAACGVGPRTVDISNAGDDVDVAGRQRVGSPFE